MAIQTRSLDYNHDGAALRAFVADDDAKPGPKPAVLVAHAWAGRSACEDDAAKRMAALGYVGVAIDVYGAGVLGASKEENEELMTPFVQDRALLRARLAAGLEAARGDAAVDGAKVAAIGFCFGGLCVLDMARAGLDVHGVASFHGLFMRPDDLPVQRIDAKVIAFHGYDDPMAPPDAMVGFANEMTEAVADWRLHAFGGTMHSFTNPDANDPDFGTVYSDLAATRSWNALEGFLQECFA
ncbi:MAG: dienelactone hydrolase family protein [Parvularculaceae bacterium]